MAPLKITKYSSFFEVELNYPQYLPCILQFAGRYVQKTMVRKKGKVFYVPDKVYATRIAGGNFRFHLGQLKPLLKHMKNSCHMDPSAIEFVEVPLPDYDTIDYTINPKYETRDYQVEAINFLTSPASYDDYHSRLAGLPTGTGKGFISLSSIAKLKTRALVLVLPKYTEKWVAEIPEVLTDVAEDEILLIEGGAALKSWLMSLKEEGPKHKFVVMSLITMRLYLNLYAEHGQTLLDHGYDLYPEEIMEYFRAGVVLFDEGHEHFHAVYQSLIQIHAARTLLLTATMISAEDFVLEMMKVAFPASIRFDNLQLEKYITVKSYEYRFANQDQFKKLRWDVAKMYNHGFLESSMGKIKGMTESYFSMIKDLIEADYIQKKEEGEKSMIFVSKIDTAEALTKYLSDEFPDLDVRKYTSGDPFENVIDADIRITTPGKSRAAIDVPKLIHVLMTVNTESIVTNLQSLGRLRKYGGKDKELIYAYTWSPMIDKQVRYHKNRLELFAEKAKYQKNLIYERGI